MAFLVASCTIPPTATLPPVATHTPTPVTPSLFPTSFLATPTASRTPTLLPTMTPTNTPTFTPRPTLSVDEAETLILDLVQKHENCQLPCLWGFIPGKSEVETARVFVKQFGIGDFRIGDIELGAQDYGDVGGVGISYPKGDIDIIIDWSYYQSKETSQLDILTMNSRPMESLGLDPINQLPMMAPVYGNLTFNQELKDYLLPSVLTNYGQPSQVLLTVWPDDPDRPDIQWHPFSLALVFSEKGIYVEYVSPRETQAENFIGCPNKSHIYLAVWEPQSDLPLEYIIEKAGSEIILSYSKSLVDATSLTLDEFYQTFKNPENTACLETPQSLWQP